jgi:HSP20 family protein
MFPRSFINLPGFGTIDPFSEMAQMRRHMDALSGLFLRGLPTTREISAGVFPLVNITENRSNYYVRAELPGLKASDLDIQITGKSLAVSGERSIPSEGENVKYHRREREAGKFSRVISLPGEIDSDRIEAKMTDGLLSVVIPKSEAARPRQITVS